MRCIVKRCMDSDWFGFGWLDCVVQVQAVTWAAVVGYPCDGWGLVLSCSPSDPVSRAGSPSPLILSHQGRGGLVVPHPVDTALKPVRACATVVSSRYSAWRVLPTLWIDESPMNL